MGRMLPKLWIVTVLAMGTACTVHETDVPPLTGPSEYAVAIRLTATPDQITQDGSSTSTVAVRATGPSGQPLSNLEIRLSTSGGSGAGVLSATTLFTGNDGRATATFTAAAAPPFLQGGPPTEVVIYATPVGSNFDASQTHTASLIVIPPPAPPPVPGAPTASVTYSPVSPKVGQLMTFNAAASMAQAGHQIVSWYWDFGDGLANDEHGNDASHTYQAAGKYYMVLGVTDDLGRSSSDVHAITVIP
jgi:PKD repeat protein